MPVVSPQTPRAPTVTVFVGGKPFKLTNEQVEKAQQHRLMLASIARMPGASIDPMSQQARDVKFFEAVVLPAVESGVVVIDRNFDPELAWTESTAWCLSEPDLWLDELVARKKLGAGWLPPVPALGEPSDAAEEHRLLGVEPTAVLHGAHMMLDLLLGHTSRRAEEVDDKTVFPAIVLSGLASSPAVVPSPVYADTDFSFYTTGPGGHFFFTAALLRGLHVTIRRVQGGGPALRRIDSEVKLDAAGLVCEPTPLLYGNNPGVFEDLKPVRLAIRRLAPQGEQVLRRRDEVVLAGVRFAIETWTNGARGGVKIGRVDGGQLGTALVPYVIAPVCELTEDQAVAFREGKMGQPAEGVHELLTSFYYSCDKRKPVAGFPFLGLLFRPLTAFPAIGFKVPQPTPYDGLYYRYDTGEAGGTQYEVRLSRAPEVDLGQ